MPSRPNKWWMRGSGVAALLLWIIVGCACDVWGQANADYPAPASARMLDGPSWKIEVRNLPNLGPVLVNGRGSTLYAFLPDGRSSASRCYARCATQWPPITLASGASSPIAGPGVHRSMLGVSRRANGALQVTYNGWPLYRWANDRWPGQANGQRIETFGGYWYALSPDGRPNQNSNPNYVHS
jgi:predicted lipoprotein with Yx(FWY)xxD motif